MHTTHFTVLATDSFKYKCLCFPRHARRAAYSKTPGDATADEHFHHVRLLVGQETETVDAA